MFVAKAGKGCARSRGQSAADGVYDKEVKKRKALFFFLCL